MITMKEKVFGKSFCCLDPGIALIGAGAIGAGGSIFSGIFGAAGSKAQASAIRDAAETARRTALELDAKQRADLAPFMGYGTKAGDTLMNMLTGNQNVGSVINNSPGYQWAEQEGMRMLNRQLSARGQWNTGAGLETLARFSGQLTSEFESKYYDRLYNLTALGANAAARTASNTASTAGSLINSQTQLGMANAQAVGNQYAAWGNTAQSLAKMGTGLVGDLAFGIPMYNASLNLMNRMSGLQAPGRSGALDMETMVSRMAGQESLALQ